MAWCPVQRMKSTTHKNAEKEVLSIQGFSSVGSLSDDSEWRNEQWLSLRPTLVHEIFYIKSFAEILMARLTFFHEGFKTTCFQIKLFRHSLGNGLPPVSTCKYIYITITITIFLDN